MSIEHRPISPLIPTVQTGEAFGWLGSQGNDLTVFSDPNALFAATPFGIGSGATYEGTTLAALGVNPGTYVWTLDAARFNNDTITLNILEPSGVPVPAPLALMTVGMLGL